MSKKILIIDDETHILELLKLNLEFYGYEVHTFDSGENALTTIEKIKPDLLLLDLMLPGENGIEICKKIRNNPNLNKMRILILSAKSEEIDKIICLEIGADDYITKPFSLRELIARIGATFRRIDPDFYNPSNEVKNNDNQENIIYYKDLKIDLKNGVIYKEDKTIELTTKEFQLFSFLVKNKGVPLSRETIFENVWKYDNNHSRSLDVHIRKIRLKLNDLNNTYIDTVRGVGYIVPNN